MKEIIIVVSILAVAILLLCVRIIIKKDKFSSQHSAENKRMRQDGINCATSQDREARRNKVNKIDVRQM